MATMNQEIVFDRLYDKHLKYLNLSGLQLKTVAAYMRAMRRIGKYFDYQVEGSTA